MIRWLPLLTLCAVASALAQDVEPSTPLVELHGAVCDPPFFGACAPSGRPPECRVLRTATSPDATVTAEIVADGDPMDLQAVHLVVGFAGPDVLRFQGVYSRQECSHFWPVAGAQTGEEALLLVRGMLRCGFSEVPERGVPGTALVV